MNPVAFFVRTCHKSNALQGATIAEKMKHASTLWRQLTPAQKAKVVSEAAKVAPKPHYRMHRVRRYLRAREPKWTPKQINAAWQAMSEEQKRSVNLKANHAHYRAAVLVGDRTRKSNAGAAFFRFVKSRDAALKKSAPKATYYERIRMAAKEWKALSAAQKKKFKATTSPSPNDTATVARVAEKLRKLKQSRKKQT
eukprot:CAMPEP_0174830602 /NCGR_PEP_ID=MMETSP1114-20130205/2611_1 /TAXON_ID=312471 /ORGANISM="Neobodo designis, Strain CCAP 1951/1" /LENGTH=195 /DNA_ID=CAMNT_0016064403 /DNA_START=32 /DNA_END=619 /DNA_ORIENTATION=+